MDFLLSSDLIEFRAVLRKFFASESSADSRRARLAKGEQKWSQQDEDSWKKFVELGAAAAGLPEEAGGLGFGAIANSVVLEEAGRALSALPIFENLTAAAWCASAKATATAQAIGEGNLRATVSFTETPPALSAKNQLDLDLKVVPSLAQASKLIVAASIGKSGTALCAIDREKLSLEPLDTFELFRDYSNVSAKAVTVGALSKDASAERLDCIIAVHAVSELAGIAARVVEMTVEYVKTREQFGRPIGSFQAIQHKLSDMHLRAEQVGSLGRFASWCDDSDPKQLVDAALAAKGMAGEYVPWIVEQSIQVHGGIGFTFEYDIHHYLRRALLLSRSFLPSGDCYTKLGERLLSA